MHQALAEAEAIGIGSSNSNYHEIEILQATSVSGWCKGKRKVITSLRMCTVCEFARECFYGFFLKSTCFKSVRFNSGVWQSTPTVWAMPEWHGMNSGNVINPFSQVFGVWQVSWYLSNFQHNLWWINVCAWWKKNAQSRKQLERSYSSDTAWNDYKSTTNSDVANS